jgi:hypothetical protein
LLHTALYLIQEDGSVQSLWTGLKRKSDCWLKTATKKLFIVGNKFIFLTGVEYGLRLVDAIEAVCAVEGI